MLVITPLTAGAVIGQSGKEASLAEQLRNDSPTRRTGRLQELARAVAVSLLSYMTSKKINEETTQEENTDEILHHQK
jgi:hypothetical protein